MSQPPFDLSQSHRWFAIELNNAAWDLVERADRAADDTERMIHAAHASCYHWLQVGTPLHHQRALCLLATAYVAAGYPASALHYGERCAVLSAENGDSQTPFDRATVHGCLAHALAALGQRDPARREYARALAYVAEFADAADRMVFQNLYPSP